LAMKIHQLHLRSGIRSQHVLCVIILVLATLLGAVLSTAFPAFAKNRGICVEARARDGSVKEIPLYSDYYALIIGCGAYKNGWPPLPNAVKDAKEVAGLFRRMGWSVDLLEDPDGNRLDTTFNRLITGKGREKDRAVLIWYSGHGHTLEEADGTRLGYIVPMDAPNPNRDEAGFMGKAMDMRQLETVAKRIRSKHVLMVFDSCFSGAIFATTRAAPSAYIQEKVAKPVRQFVTAGREDEEVPDRSVFKTCFIQGVGEGYADRNKDGYVTGEELGSYLQEKVVNYSGKAQHPQYGKINNPKLDKGDFIFLAGGSIVTQESSPQRPRSGSMKIRSQPTGASVFVEGIDRGKAPILLKDLSPGTFSVQVKLEGYEDQEKTVRVRAGRTASVQFFLDEVVKKGRLYVTTEPEDARVKILNITPRYREGIELDAGRYHIEVSKTYYETENRWVELSAGEDLDVQIRLKPEADSAEQFSATVARQMDLYQQAIDLIKKTRFKDAKETLKTYIEKYPHGKRVANAHFWMGECEYNLQRFEEAILEYQKVISRYPKSNKVPDSLLKQGITFAKLGDNESAKIVLNKLIKKYPKSPQHVRVAKKKLARLK